LQPLLHDSYSKFLTDYCKIHFHITANLSIFAGASARKQLFCKLKHRLVCRGLQMCCFVRWLFIISSLFSCLFAAKYRCVVFFTLAPNVLALGAVADFGAQNCQYTTKADAR
jgi:hypothetical protein